MGPCLYLVSVVSADGLVALGARISAGTKRTLHGSVYIRLALCLLMAWWH